MHNERDPRHSCRGSFNTVKRRHKKFEGGVPVKPAERRNEQEEDRKIAGVERWNEGGGLKKTEEVRKRSDGNKRIVLYSSRNAEG
jgi:hypothetical protein